MPWKIFNLVFANQVQEVNLKDKFMWAWGKVAVTGPFDPPPSVATLNKSPVPACLCDLSP